jgi:stress-induced morphogen
MPIAQSELETLLSNAFPEAKISILDLVGDNNHYQVTIISERFLGKSRIEQHRIVNNALKHELRGDLHALSIITKTEE